MAEAASSSAPSTAPATRNPQLSVQDLATLNVAELDALSPQVISRQATINIGVHEPQTTHSSTRLATSTRTV